MSRYEGLLCQVFCCEPASRQCVCETDDGSELTLVEHVEPFWSRNEYRAGLNGLFLDETTYARDETGDVSPRYEAVILAHPDEGRFDLLGFSAVGEVQRAVVEVSGPPDRPS